MPSNPRIPGSGLLVVAAPLEARAALHALHHPTPGIGPATPADQDPPIPGPWQRMPLTPNLDLLVTGVGKAAAAGALAAALRPGPGPNTDAWILHAGIAGSLPHPSGHLPLGATILADTSILADEGVATPDRFIPLDAMGFGPFPDGTTRGAIDPTLRALLAPIVDAVGPIATVSACSGTDAAATDIARRTGALAECMEGAALALVAHRLRVPFAELRVISNTTGERSRQAWDLPRAQAALTRILGRALAILTDAPRDPVGPAPRSW